MKARTYIENTVKRFDAFYSKNLGLTYMLFSCVFNAIYLLIFKYTTFPAMVLIFEAQSVSLLSSLLFFYIFDITIVLL